MVTTSSGEMVCFHKGMQFPWGTNPQLWDSGAIAERNRADAMALWRGSAESNVPDTRGNLLMQDARRPVVGSGSREGGGVCEW